MDGQLGLESTPDEYVSRMVGVFHEVQRVLRDDGTVWLNLGDSYTGSGCGGVSADKTALRGGLTSQNASKGLKQRMKATFRNDRARLPYSCLSGPGLKPKDLVGIPWRVAFALQADGWYLRSDIIWHKPNPMPESVTDRPTRSHEYLFLLSKSQRYYYDSEAIREPAQDWGARDRKAGSAFVDGTPGRSTQSGGKDCDFAERGRNKRDVWTVPDGPPRVDKQRGHGRRHAGFNDRWDAMSKEEQGENGRNKRDVWTIATRPCPDTHFATFPEALVEPCVLAGSRPGDVVLDPFVGTGTAVKVAARLGRKGIGLELSPEYCTMAHANTWNDTRQLIF